MDDWTILEKDENKLHYGKISRVIFQEEFRNEGDCYAFLLKTRWPNGFVCPKCGEKRYWRVFAQGLYKCIKCCYRVSLTAGTVFHKTRTPLMKWFIMIFRMATTKAGISINEMKRDLEIKDYKTVWAMAHKIREAMNTMTVRDTRYMLKGLVEIDKSFFSPSFSDNKKRGMEKKELVIIAVSAWKHKSGKEIPGFLHAFVAENVNVETIEDILKRVGISKEKIKPLIKAIHSDGWRSYQILTKKLGIVHNRAVFCDLSNYINLLPWTHKVIENARAVFAGTHRGVSKKHLHRYLSEICYRINRRFWGHEVFHRLLFACASTNTITRNELMAD